MGLQCSQQVLIAVNNIILKGVKAMKNEITCKNLNEASQAKLTYEEPKIDIIYFSSADILTSSNEGEWDINEPSKF